jgi:hypothetical protein
VKFVEPDGRFGASECRSDRASDLSGDLVWPRKQDETQEEFKRRVMADVRERRGSNRTLIIFDPA